MTDVFWISSAQGTQHVPLAIVLRPRGGEWLEDELIRIKRTGIETLVSMLEKWEAEYLGLATAPACARRAGLTFLSYPIPDRQVPDDSPAFRIFAAGLAQRLGRGERIGIHCRGSIGRSTIAAACALVHLGWKPTVALAAIEKARGCAVPDTEEQRNWILRYKADL